MPNLRIGIVGLGVMGTAHFGVYATMPSIARVTALADIDPAKRRGDWSAIGGNITTGGQITDLSGIHVYADYRDLIHSSDVDVVDVTLPTYLHKECVVAALAAGKHVICEKPMAMTASDANAMADAARRFGKMLFVAQCIRFWPSYALAATIIRDRRYGTLRSARFQRLSALPTWSWDQWLMDDTRSGRAALDFHIHDADFVMYAFGKPTAVSSYGFRNADGGYDHIVTRYRYDDGRLIFTEGAWGHAPGYPFSMTFTLQFEQGTLVLGTDGLLVYYPGVGGREVLPVPEGSGYDHELRHFLECISSGKESTIISPESAAASVALIEAEIRSAKTGVEVAFLR